MAPTKEDIKTWVDTPPRNREWLAAQCGGISPRTVNNWLTSSSVEIPAKALRIIESLMRADQQKQEAAQPSLSHLVVRVGVDEFEQWEHLALDQHKTVTDWAINAIRKAYETEMAGNTKSIISFPQAKKKAHLQAAAGDPLNADVQEWNAPDNTVLVKLSGQSMEPKFYDGDVLAMKHKRASRNLHMKKGLIYLVRYKDGYTVKKFNSRPAKPKEIEEEVSYYSEGDKTQKVHVLQSLNPDFEDMVINDDIDWIAWLPSK